MSTLTGNESTPRSGEIKVIGIPFDENSSFRRGPANAPQRIREAFRSESANLWTETGIDLGPRSGWQMGEDLACSGQGPIYLSVDLDCLDPAFAPGVSHHEPGGLSTREVLNIIHHLPGTIVGADIVEYNPERDLHGMTGMVAGKLLKEILGRMIG